MMRGEAKVFVSATDGLNQMVRAFKTFSMILGPRPSRTTLDRVNPQDHYTPLNCKWGTPKEQGFHKTNIMWKDETPPPIPSIRDTNEQIDDIFGHEPY